MSVKFITGFLAGSTTALAGAFAFAMVLMPAVQSVLTRAEMAEERAWTRDQFDEHDVDALAHLDR